MNQQFSFNCSHGLRQNIPNIPTHLRRSIAIGTRVPTEDDDFLRGPSINICSPVLLDTVPWTPRTISVKVSAEAQKNPLIYAHQCTLLQKYYRKGFKFWFTRLELILDVQNQQSVRLRRPEINIEKSREGGGLNI